MPLSVDKNQKKAHQLLAAFFGVDALNESEKFAVNLETALPCAKRINGVWLHPV